MLDSSYFWDFYNLSWSKNQEDEILYTKLELMTPAMYKDSHMQRTF